MVIVTHFWLKKKKKFVICISLLAQRREIWKSTAYVGFVSAQNTPRCIILQLVNSCPHPVSDASCVPLSPFFFLFFPLWCPLSCRAAPRRCGELRGEMPYGAPENWPKMVDRCIPRLVARLWHTLLSPSSSHLRLNAVRYFSTRLCKSAKRGEADRLRLLYYDKFSCRAIRIRYIKLWNK